MTSWVLLCMSNPQTLQVILSLSYHLFFLLSHHQLLINDLKLSFVIEKNLSFESAVYLLLMIPRTKTEKHTNKSKKVSVENGDAH